MPIRTPRNGSDLVGGSSESKPTEAQFRAEVKTLLLTRSEPKHCRDMELLLTGKYNPFCSEAPEQVHIRTGSGYTKSEVRLSSLWNVFEHAITLGIDRKICCSTFRRVYDGFYELPYAINTFVTIIDLQSETRAPRYDPDKIHSAVTNEALVALEEEGIPKKLASSALTGMLNTGIISSRCIAPGGTLYAYSPERRHLVARIFNWINENARVEPVTAEVQDNEYDPMIDMGTGMPVGTNCTTV